MFGLWEPRATRQAKHDRAKSHCTGYIRQGTSHPRGPSRTLLLSDEGSVREAIRVFDFHEADDKTPRSSATYSRVQAARSLTGSQ